ncbi:MAG: anthranilate synthase component I [Methanosarcinales archaeon]|nr:MAG: anthranilate synthase component I [Methanosarcinales archaeon]
MINPGKKQFLEMAEEAKKPCVIALHKEVVLNKTPLECYGALYSDRCYILESMEKEKRHARFSFVGASPSAVISANGGMKLEALDDTGRQLSTIAKPYLKRTDAFNALSSLFESIEYQPSIHFGRHVFMGGLIGYISYDAALEWAGIKSRHEKKDDFKFMFSPSTILFDHLEDKTYIIFNALITPDIAPEEAYAGAVEGIKRMEAQINSKPAHVSKTLVAASHSNTSKGEYEDLVRKAKEHIYDGDIFQVVLSRWYEFDCEGDALQIYKRLRDVNPSPYMYCIRFGDDAIIGASPETLVTVHGRKVITNPIAGTRGRGATEEEDERLAEEMKHDPKEVAEHVMLVDLGRNDVAKVSKPGSVVVDDYMSVLKYSHVQHLESTVTGILKDECSMFDAVRAIFPAGTVSGAPKSRAMEIIDEFEKGARGIYAGGLGYFSFNGDADFAITIRTIVKEANKLSIQAGAGIVADSVPENEYYESEKKMDAMLRTIETLEEA